jgi:hypothetical protein
LLPPSHPVSLIFLDETGRVGRDNIFGVGCLKVSPDTPALRDFREIRHSRNVHHELQWKRIDKTEYGARAVEASEELLRYCATRGNAQFCAIFEDGREPHLARRYGDRWRAYEALARDAILAVIEGDELVAVVADRYTPPKDLAFEQTVRREVNRHLGRLAVVSLVRFKSSSTDGLQAVDLLLGAIGFDLRYPGETGKEKGRLARLVRETHGVVSYRPNGRSEVGWYEIETRIPRPRGKRGGRAGRHG